MGYALGKAKTRYVRKHYKEVKVRRNFYEELRKLAEERGLSVPAMIEEMFKHYTGPSMAGHTVPSIPGVTQSKPDRVTPSVQVTRRDYFWWTIRAGEGWNAIEVSLNNIQLRKLCQTKLLAQEVCEKADLSRF